MINTKLLEPHHLPLNKQLSAQLHPSSISAEELREADTTESSDAVNIVDMEQRMVTEALERTKGNVTRAAELLGLSRDTLRYRIDKHRISIPN